MRRSLIPFVWLAGLAVALVGTVPVATRLLAQDAAAPAKANETEAAQVSPEEAAIRKSAADFIAAFERHDAKAIANLWTADGEYIDQFGQSTQGRDAIEKEYADFFDANDGVKMRLVIDSIHFVSPTVAIEDGRAALDPSPADEPVMCRYAAVHVKQDGHWRVARVQDMHADNPVNVGQLSDLDWLVGSWTAEHAGAKADIDCRWIAEKSYLQRTFTVSREGKVVATSTEIIGWDPLDGGITSWTFSSEGGRAEGIWTPYENGWGVESEGITRNGMTTEAVNFWSRLEGGAIGWRSVERSVDDFDLEDARDLVFKRVDSTTSPVKNGQEK